MERGSAFGVGSEKDPRDNKGGGGVRVSYVAIIVSCPILAHSFLAKRELNMCRGCPFNGHNLV
jgi:hypothetical protein